MKFSEMNAREKKAFLNIKHASNWLIGGLENDTMDYSSDSAEYKDAVSKLDDYDYLVDELYKMATTSIYGDGYVCFDERTVEQELRDINFCGKESLMKMCRSRIDKCFEEGICIG